MIVVGISPGLRSLVYCMLFFPDESEASRPELRDIDLLKGGRVKKGMAPPAAELRRKANPHALILDVVLERAMAENGRTGVTTLVAVGPSVDQKEPGEHDAIVRELLRQLVTGMKALGLAIEYQEWRTGDELKGALGGDVRKAVNRSINKATTVMRSPGFIMAIAAALAGHRASAERLLPRRASGL